jgi:hypothetical protein
MKSKWGLSIKKNKDGVDFRYFRQCRHFEYISLELGATNFHINTILGIGKSESF